MPRTKFILSGTFKSKMRLSVFENKEGVREHKDTLEQEVFQVKYL